MEQIFKRGVIIDKHLQHQRDLFQNFIDFKVFGSVRHANLWRVLRSFNMHEGLLQTIQALYEISSSAVLLNSQPGEFFKTTGDVRQGCLLSPILFSLFVEKSMQETLHRSISIGGRPLCNLRFAVNIDLMGGSNDELQDLTNRLVDRASAY